MACREEIVSWMANNSSTFHLVKTTSCSGKERIKRETQIEMMTISFYLYTMSYRDSFCVCSLFLWFYSSTVHLTIVLAAFVLAIHYAIKLRAVRASAAFTPFPTSRVLLQITCHSVPKLTATCRRYENVGVTALALRAP